MSNEDDTHRCNVRRDRDELVDSRRENVDALVAVGHHLLQRALLHRGLNLRRVLDNRRQCRTHVGRLLAGQLGVLLLLAL